MYFITKDFNLSAAHHLECYEGKCKNPHGHNYQIFITVQCSKLLNNGIGVDFGDIKEVYQRVIHDNYDHKDLNETQPFVMLKDHPEQVSGLNPTAENMARIFYQFPKTDLPRLYSVKIDETPTSCVEYREDTDTDRFEK